jgi:hypothetical protein
MGTVIAFSEHEHRVRSKRVVLSEKSESATVIILPVIRIERFDDASPPASRSQRRRRRRRASRS